MSKITHKLKKLPKHYFENDPERNKWRRKLNKERIRTANELLKSPVRTTVKGFLIDSDIKLVERLTGKDVFEFVDEWANDCYQLV